MKNAFKSFRVKFLAATFLLGMVISIPGNAQNDRPAIIDPESKVVSLDEDVPYGYIYYLDLGENNFSTEKEAKDFFRKYNTELASFSVHFAEKQVHITLQLRQRPDWTINDWNQYLAENTPEN